MKNMFRFWMAILFAVSIFLPVLPASAGNHLALPDEEIAACAGRMRELSLVTNDGKTMTYGEAVAEICDKAVALAKAEAPGAQEKEAALRGLISKRLWMQQYGSDLRCVGDHGIRHIYGNIERALHFLKDFPAHVRLAAVVCHIYHDIGYTDPDILFGAPDENGEIAYASKFDHDTRSWDYFETNDRPFWQSLGVFSEGDFAAMKDAVSLHNTDTENYAKHIGRAYLTEEEQGAIEAKLRACLDVNVNPVVAAVHLGDKLALSQREKMPLVLADTPEISGWLTEAYGVQLMKKAVPKATELEIAERLRRMAATAAQNGAGRAYFRPEAFGERDLKLDSGKRFLPMNFVQTDSDCLSVQSVNGVRYAHITLKVLDYDEGEKLLGGELAGRQLQKFFKDVGIQGKENVRAYIRKAFADGGVELPGTHVIVEIKKEAMAAGDERRPTRQAIAKAVQDSPVYRIGRAYRDIRDACKSGRADDVMVWKMRQMMEEFGGVDETALEKFEAQAAPPADEREADALLKAFDKCLKKSALQDLLENYWAGDAESAAA